jgi:NAD(P)-dependent dehydrogenase (short-subunit alcohol dehydrogenase family)
LSGSVDRPSRRRCRGATTLRRASFRQYRAAILQALHDLWDEGAMTQERIGRIDILVNNAAFQRTYENLEDIPDEEWSYTFRTNIEAMFHLSKATVPHMRPGSSIINTTSIQSDKPSPMLLAYASTKGAVSNFTAGLAQMLGSKGIRVNAVAPGPIWTPLIPSTMPDEKVKSFGQDTPLGRAGQPKELAGIYVLLASDEGSYMTGGIYAVTGGTPLL